MVREPWNYDHRSHQVILNVRRNGYGRRRKRRTNGAGPSLLNRPRVVVLGIILTVLVFTFLREARFVLASNPQFKIQQILIENTELLDKTTLIQLLGLKDTDTLFGVSAKQLSLRLKKDPDIESVIVEKRFPDTLRIVVNERIPYVRIKMDNKEYLLDYNGIVLWRKREAGSSFPLVLGVEENKIVPGERYSDVNLESALDILRIGGQCGWGRYVEVTEIDMRGLDKIAIKTRERILINIKREDVKAQLERLMSIMTNTERRGRIIRKVELRFKDVYVE